MADAEQAWTPLPYVPAVFIDGGKGGVAKTMFGGHLTIEMRRTRQMAFTSFDVDSDQTVSMFGIGKDGDMGHVSAPGTDKDRLFQPVRVTFSKDCKIKVASPGLIAGTRDHAYTLDGAGNAGLVRTLVEKTVWGHVDLVVVDLPAGSSDEWRAAMDVFHRKVGIFVMVHPGNIEDLHRAIERIEFKQQQIIGVVEAFGKCVFEDGEEPVHPKDPKRVFNPWGRNSEVKKVCDDKGLTYLGVLPLTDGLRRVAGRLTLPPTCLGPVAEAAKVVDDILSKEVSA